MRKPLFLLLAAVHSSLSFASSGFAAQVVAPDAIYDAATATFRDTLAQLVKADTSRRNEARAVEILCSRLKEEKIPYEVLDFSPGRQNLVARLKGSGEKKPLLLLAHLDVVGTKDQNWSTDPHTMAEKDGFLIGRGVRDDLGMAVANLEVFLMLKRAGTPLVRDVILAFTGDEELGGSGMRDLLARKPEWVNAEIALNEGGGQVTLDSNGKAQFVKLQMAEKIYQDFKLSARGITGHSSVPKKDNSIYRLSGALARLGQYEPELRLLPVTRAYFLKRARVEGPLLQKAMLQLANSRGPLPKDALKIITEDPLSASLLSTTCVATMLSAGTQVNALPPLATANVNCRILPDETVAQVAGRLKKIIQDPLVDISLEEEMGHSGPSPIAGEVPRALDELAQATWPGIPLIPYLSVGATDSRYLRERGIAAYGFFPFAATDAEGARAHGVDERIAVSSIRPGLELYHRLVLKLVDNGARNTQ